MRIIFIAARGDHDHESNRLRKQANDVACETPAAKK